MPTASDEQIRAYASSLANKGACRLRVMSTHLQTSARTVTFTYALTHPRTQAHYTLTHALTGFLAHITQGLPDAPGTNDGACTICLVVIKGASAPGTRASTKGSAPFRIRRHGRGRKKVGNILPNVSEVGTPCVLIEIGRLWMALPSAIFIEALAPPRSVTDAACWCMHHREPNSRLHAHAKIFIKSKGSQTEVSCCPTFKDL